MAKLSDILNIANSRIGVCESPPNSNNVDCNTWYYGHPVNGSAYPWCCVEMMYEFHLANADGLLKRTASCTTLMNWFKKNGKYSTTPKVGSLVFFNFDKKPDKNKAKHIGIVVEVGNGYVYSIEGNTSSSNKGSQDNGGIVAKRKRNFSSIVGYGVVDYSDTYAPTKPSYPTLRKGTKGSYVLLLQQRLVVLGYPVDIDGSYGSQTEKAVKKFQKDNGLAVDGVCGKNTWNKIMEGVL